MIANYLQRNPRIVVLLLAVIIVGGLSSALVIPKLEDPVLRNRVGVLSTVFPGADARRVEAFVSARLEKRLQSIDEIRQVRSNSRQGISNLIIELRDEVNDVDRVWDEVRKSIADADAEGVLPVGSLRPVLEIFPLKAFSAIVSVQWKGESQINETLVRRIAGQLADEINRLPGTEQVETFGDDGEEFLVEMKPEILAAMNTTVEKIASQISADFVTQPTGTLRSNASGQSGAAGTSGILLDLSDTAATRRSLGAITLRDGMGKAVSLNEIATIKKTTQTLASQLAIVNARPAIVLAAFASQRTPTRQWNRQLDRLIEQFAASYSAEVTIEKIFSQQQHIETRLSKLLTNLLIGTLAVVGIVWLLMGWRSMIVVGIAVPLSAAMVLLAMRLFGIPLHQMSITGLIVALGLLIDNAIVIVEDMRGRMRQGVTVRAAVVASIAHLKIPLLGSTLTTTLAFLPIALLPGPSGEFVGTIAISVIFAIAASFLLSMTLVPAMFALLGTGFDGSVQSGTESYSGGGLKINLLQRIYEWTLGVVFRFPLLGVVLSGLLPAAGFWSASILPEQFFPASDRQQIQIEVELSAASTLEQTTAVVRAMEPIVQNHSGVRRAHWFVGRSAPTFYYNVVPRRRGTPFYAQAIVDLETGAWAAKGGGSMAVVDLLQQKLDTRFPEARVIVRQLEQGPPFDAPVELRLQGPEIDVLRTVGSQLRLFLTQLPDVTHTRSDLEETIAKIEIDVDPQHASDVGLNRAAITGQLYQSLEGASAGVAFDGDQEIPIRVRLESAGTAAESLGRLKALRLPSAAPPNSGGADDTKGALGAGQGGGLSGAGSMTGTPLAAIAELKLDGDVGAIVRIDGIRTNEIMAYLRPGVLPSKVVEEFKRRLALTDLALPAGYTLTFGGETAQRSQAVNQLIANAALISALMVLTLVASLGSFRQATIVVIVGGLSIGLGPLALFVFGYPLGFMAIVGTMGLAGIAINDSIVVLAAIAETGTTSVEALVRTVSGCTRHIVATTLTTIVGFLPLILSGGGFWPPLAVTIAAGVAGATFMALYLAPTLYVLFYGRWLKSR